MLQYRSLLKENINFWEDDLTTQECVTVTEDTEHEKSWKAF